MDILLLRNALIGTLSILLLVVLLRRFRQYVLRRDVPAPLHAELLELEVLYHPARLRVVLHMPQAGTLQLQLLDAQHCSLHAWGPVDLVRGQHDLVRELPDLPDGLFHLDVRTATQRTVRGFRLQQA